MPRIENMLDRFQRCPALFTGENTLTSIYHFVSGYNCAMEQYAIPAGNDPLFLSGEFHDWVAYRLHFKESTSGWCNMIRDRTDSDQHAIDHFFQLLAEFRERQPHTVARLVGFQKTYQQSCLSRDDNDEVVQSPFVTLNYPESISLVTYTTDPGFFAYSDTADSFPAAGFHPSLKSFESRTGADRSLLTILDKSWDPRS